MSANSTRPMPLTTMRATLRAGVAGLPALYRVGTLTPTQAVDAYYSRIAAYNASLGAFVTLLDADARREAAESSARWTARRPLSPLDGLPIAVKANIAVKGAPFHAGIRAYADRVAAEDAACVAALRQRGAIILGLLAMDEGALGGTGDNPWLGRTRNPYRQGFSPGGSSSGAGAAVTAGLCAAALGTDTMGSVRLPAGFCGCVGYKPSRDLISREGVVPLANSLDHVGVLARSVEDCAIVAAGAAFDNLQVPQWDRFAGTALGVLDDFSPTTHDIRIAIGGLIARAAAAGAQVIPLDFTDYDFNGVRRHCLLAIEVEAMREHPIVQTDSTGFSDGFVQMLRYGASQPETKIAQAYAAIADAASFLRAQLEIVSAMILPTSLRAAFRFEDTQPSVGDFTAPANAAGLPAMALPIGLSADGLPLSVQCIGQNDVKCLEAARWIAARADPTPPPTGLGLD